MKRLVRLFWSFEFGVRRRVRRLRGDARYALGGECQSCAKCCEEPAIAAGALIWYVPMLRRVFLGWQRHVNGFDLSRGDREEYIFYFRCSHFDPETRRCDSYATRPFMCRDYPRLLLDQPWPELFPECGHRAIDTQGAKLRDAIEALDAPAAQKEKLKRRLHLL